MVDTVNKLRKLAADLPFVCPTSDPLMLGCTMQNVIKHLVRSGGCKQSAPHWVTWMRPRSTPCFTEPQKLCGSARFFSDTVLRKCPQLATMLCSRGVLPSPTQQSLSALDALYMSWGLVVHDDTDMPHHKCLA